MAYFLLPNYSKYGLYNEGEIQYRLQYAVSLTDGMHSTSHNLNFLIISALNRWFFIDVQRRESNLRITFEKFTFCFFQGKFLSQFS